MNDENGGNGRRRRNRNAAIGGVTQAEQEIQEQVEEPTDATPQHADSLDDLLRGIYSSVVEAQNTIEQHYIGEISEDYFDEEGNPMATSNWREQYDIHSTPVIYLLNKDKEIIAKRINDKQIVKIIEREENLKE